MLNVKFITQLDRSVAQGGPRAAQAAPAGGSARPPGGSGRPPGGSRALAISPGGLADPHCPTGWLRAAPGWLRSGPWVAPVGPLVARGPSLSPPEASRTLTVSVDASLALPLCLSPHVPRGLAGPRYLPRGPAGRRYLPRRPRWPSLSQVSAESSRALALSRRGLRALAISVEASRARGVKFRHLVFRLCGAIQKPQLWGDV